MEDAAILEDVDERGKRHRPVMGRLAVADGRVEFERRRIKLLHGAPQTCEADIEESIALHGESSGAFSARIQAGSRLSRAHFLLVYARASFLPARYFGFFLLRLPICPPARLYRLPASLFDPSLC